MYLSLVPMALSAAESIDSPRSYTHFTRDCGYLNDTDFLPIYSLCHLPYDCGCNITHNNGCEADETLVTMVLPQLEPTMFTNQQCILQNLVEQAPPTFSLSQPRQAYIEAWIPDTILHDS